MRAVWAAALAVLSALGLQEAGPATRVVVVVDSDAPAADPVSAAQLRDRLLALLDGEVAVSFHELTAAGLTAIPPAESAQFRRTRFTTTPPTYSGVSLTFAEGVEVLRGNEFVRDSVVERECPVPPGDCAGRVHAAVQAEVRRAENASARKLRTLAAAAAAWRGARVVMFTSGWPTRDDGRVGVGAAVRKLHDSGLSLVVVHVPPVAPHRGLVRDASESLAAHLPAGFVPLAVEADVVSAADVAWAGLPRADLAAAGEALPVPGRPPGVATAAATPAAADPDPPAPGVADPGAGAVTDPVLRRAAAYVARFERAFTAVLWHERYEQETRVPRRFGSSGASTTGVAERRLLESELFFAWLPGDATWISVRDVVAVDGRLRPESERRLPSLAARATLSLPELRELAEENGRFNLGHIVRTFNEPTLALLFLDQRHLTGVRFTRTNRQQVAGRSRITYQFVEHRRPTLIRSGDQDLPVGGTLSIDEASGAVWSTKVEMSAAGGGLTGSMAVDYEPHVAFDVLVPREMRESYASSMQRIDALATYSDFRRFQTSGRLILTP